MLCKSGCRAEATIFKCTFPEKEALFTAAAFSAYCFFFCVCPAVTFSPFLTRGNQIASSRQIKNSAEHLQFPLAAF